MTIELTADRWKVSVTETRSIGQYEPFKAHASLEGELPEGPVLDADLRLALAAHLLATEKTLTEVVERTTENRTRPDDERDWGVPSRD